MTTLPVDLNGSYINYYNCCLVVEMCRAFSNNGGKAECIQGYDGKARSKEDH
jgi:hypothetical protein